MTPVSSDWYSQYLADQWLADTRLSAERVNRVERRVEMDHIVNSLETIALSFRTTEQLSNWMWYLADQWQEQTIARTLRLKTCDACAACGTWWNACGMIDAALPLGRTLFGALLARQDLAANPSRSGNLVVALSSSAGL